jgi:hypothetical protein
MRKSLRFSAVLLTALILSVMTFAQSATITGTVKNSTGAMEGVPAVSVTVRGGTQGVFTDASGNFKITVPALPVVLVFSSVGYEMQEVTVTSAASPITVDLIPGATLGQEVVVAATRTPQRILESPVSIERVGLSMIRNTAAPHFYDIVKNLKGVD